MKRSMAVVLIGMGAAALSACGKHDDCKDNDPNSQACAADHTSASSHAQGGVFSYFGGGSSSSSSGGGEAESGTSRGGIGATGEGHASAGGEGGGHGGGSGE